MKSIFACSLFILSTGVVTNAFAASLANKPVLPLAIVKNSVASVNAKGKLQGHQFAVSVVDDGGNLLYAERPEGVAPGMMDAAIGKAQTAARYGIATQLIEQQVTSGRVSYLSLPKAVPIEGGIPIVLQGHIIGALGVAGSASDIDEAAAQAGATALTAALNAAVR